MGKNKLKIGIVLAGLIGVFGLSETYGQERKPYFGKSVNKRQHTQQRRIYNGIRSGELTRREAQRLGHQQTRIDRMEDRFRTSGSGLSLRERYRLYNAQNRASRSIYRQKHDKQSR